MKPTARERTAALLVLRKKAHVIWGTARTPDQQNGEFIEKKAITFDYYGQL